MPAIRRPLKLDGVTDLDWSYAAGIVDGEGCIAIVRVGSDYPDNYVLRVEVSTSDDIICPWLHATFGGVFSTNTKRTKTFSGREYVTRVNRWSVANATSEEFVRGIMPWLKLKKEHANLALRFRATFGADGRNITEETRAARKCMYGEMKLIRARRRAS